MTALAEKLQSAGIDTLGARITNICIEGLRLYPDNLRSAWAHVGSSYGYDMLRALAKDMGLPEIPAGTLQPAYRTSAITPDRVELKQKMREFVRSKYKNSGGVAWSDVAWHELPALTRDGKEASALLQASPAAVPNDGRTVGQVLGVKKVDEIIKAVRT